jgi:hypothetical protein
MFILLILFGIATTFAFFASKRTVITSMINESEVAGYLADAGIEFAIYCLSHNLTMEVVTTDPPDWSKVRDHVLINSSPQDSSKQLFPSGFSKVFGIGDALQGTVGLFKVAIDRRSGQPLGDTDLNNGTIWLISKGLIVRNYSPTLSQAEIAALPISAQRTLRAKLVMGGVSGVYSSYPRNYFLQYWNEQWR